MSLLPSFGNQTLPHREGAPHTPLPLAHDHSMRSENWCRSCPMFYKWEFQKTPLRKQREGVQGKPWGDFALFCVTCDNAFFLWQEGIRQRMSETKAAVCCGQLPRRAVLQSIGILPGSTFPVLSAVPAAVIHSLCVRHQAPNQQQLCGLDVKWHLLPANCNQRNRECWRIKHFVFFSISTWNWVFLIRFCILQAQSNAMDVSVEINDLIKESVPSGSFAGGYRCSSLLFLSRVDEAQVDFM